MVVLPVIGNVSDRYEIAFCIVSAAFVAIADLDWPVNRGINTIIRMMPAAKLSPNKAKGDLPI